MPTQAAAQCDVWVGSAKSTGQTASTAPSARPFRHVKGRRHGTARTTTALAAMAVIVLAPAAEAAEGAAAAQPGAYCPLPEPGQKPVCLAPAEAKYGAFFAALERGAVSSDEAAAVESDLTPGADSEDAYLALSSLSYGYWRLAEQVGAEPDADPALHERLARWNLLMIELYNQAVDDPAFRAAVREAASDLHRRSPPRAAPCPNRYPGGCVHTDQLVRALAAIDDTAGVRSPLGRLLQRMMRGDEAGVVSGLPRDEVR